MKLHFENFLSILKTAGKKWWAKDPFRESAVIAYYAIFSMPGLLVIVVTFAGYFFGEDAVRAQMEAQVAGTLGTGTADQIQSIIITASQKGNSTMATIIGIGTIFIGATGVFAQFQKSLNLIWEVQADPNKSGLWKLIKVRLFSFGLVGSISFMLIISLVISTLLAAFGNWLAAHFSTPFHVILEVLNFMMSLSVLAGLFALMFRVLPDAVIKWGDVLIGSFVTALLFELGKLGMGFYFGTASPATVYGAAGSLILILIWVSYSTMIVFFGAEFTHAYAKVYGGKVKPTEVATVAKVEVTVEGKTEGKVEGK